MCNLAPISVSTYSRINHLKQTIGALKNNTLAKKSELYIFSDAPQKGDEDIVAEVREYIHSIRGFKEVHIIEQEQNNIKENIRQAIELPLNKYGKIIRLEDDIVTATGFLQYLNDGLEYYKRDPRIINITGYAQPMPIPSAYTDDVLLLQRYNCWGHGMWAEKYCFIKHEIDFDEYVRNINNKTFYKKLISNGDDIPNMLESVVYGRNDAFDVKVVYQQVLNDWFTIYPRKSLTKNIGHDGTGVNCGISNKFNVELWDKVDSFEFVNNIQLDKRIVKENQKFNSLGLKGRIGNFTKKLGIYPYLKSLKDRLKL